MYACSINYLWNQLGQYCIYVIHFQLYTVWNCIPNKSLPNFLRSIHDGLRKFWSKGHIDIAIRHEMVRKKAFPKAKWDSVDILCCHKNFTVDLWHNWCDINVQKARLNFGTRFWGGRNNIGHMLLEITRWKLFEYSTIFIIRIPHSTVYYLHYTDMSLLVKAFYIIR